MKDDILKFPPYSNGHYSGPVQLRFVSVEEIFPGSWTEFEVFDLTMPKSAKLQFKQ